VTRDGTGIGVGGGITGSRTMAAAAIPEGGALNNVAWEWLDSPATVSAVSYQVQVQIASGGTVYINRTSGDADNVNNGRTASTLTLTEVFQ